MKHLNMMKSSMILKEAKEWIKSMWMIKAMENVPMRWGYACNLCQYCTSDKKSMRVHFSNKHQELKTSENSQEYTIQISFKSKLWKYIQVNEYENEMMREEEKEENEEWNKTLEKKFEKSIEWINISKNNKHDDFQLMKVFIAKIR